MTALESAYKQVRQRLHVLDAVLRSLSFKEGSQAAATVKEALDCKGINRLHEVGTREYYDTMIDCAAIQTADGKVWHGKRHGHCFKTIKQAYGVPAHKVEGDGKTVEGFITMSDRFVDRKEAAELVKATGQCVPVHDPNQLYSEDLY